MLKRKFNILYILGVKDIKRKFLNIINSDLLSICINYFIRWAYNKNFS